MSRLFSLPIFKDDQKVDSAYGFQHAFGFQLSKFSLIGLGASAIILMWALAIFYIKTTPKTYASEWGINVLGSSPGVDVALPEGWRASTNPGEFKSLTTEDPRADYVYLMQSSELLETAAASMELSSADFGGAAITTDQESSIIGMVMEGETPEQAQQKSLALYETLENRIEELRQQEVARRKEDTQKEIDAARQQLEDAQVKLLSHQSASGLSSDAQLEDLAVGIEQLRRQYAQALAQEKGFDSRAQKLELDIQEASRGSNDAYKLLSDPVYQNQFAAYGVAAAEYASLTSQLGSAHPQLVEKQAEMEGLANVLETRASFLLGKPTDQLTLNQLAAIAQDPSVEVARGNLFQAAILDRANQIELRAQSQELSNQIIELESRLRKLTESQVQAEIFESDLQAAEAFLASSITKLTLNEDGIDSIYPPIQLAAEPTLPDEDAYLSPNPKIAIVGALAGSFLVVVGLILFWPRENDQRILENDALADFPFNP